MTFPKKSARVCAFVAHRFQLLKTHTPAAFVFAVFLVVALSGNAARNVSPVGGDFPGALAMHAPHQQRQIPSEFFGMHVGSTTRPWPLAEVGMLRLHSTHTNWTDIEQNPQNYGFDTLDSWIALAEKYNVPLIYTFVGVPHFYSSDPNDSSCNYGPGSCHPPQDVNADGSGTDASFKSFVKALVNHVGNKIQYWEMWNEPDMKTQWIPTDANLPYNQIMRMSQDAEAIIKGVNPNALMLTPAPVGYPNLAYQWIGGYLAAGGGQYADVIAFHGYLNQSWKLGDYPVAENEVRLVANIRKRMKENGQQNKPLWITEGGWGNVNQNGFKDPVLQTAFTARYVLLQESLGIDRAVWFQWDNPLGAGTLWNGPKRKDLRMPGVAYQQVAQWTSGATITAPCKPYPGTSVWTCQYSRPNGYKAMAIWSTAGLTRVNVPSEFKRRRGLLGKRSNLGSSVKVGIWPILLENTGSEVRTLGGNDAP